MKEVCLLPGQSIRLLGQALAEVQEGSVDIFGYRLDKNYIRIASPRIYPLVTIRNVERYNAKLKLQYFENGLEKCEITRGVKFLGDFKNGETFQVDPSYDEFPDTLSVPDSWRDSMIQIVNSEIVPPIICVCGNKKVGKSSFSRFASNFLLNTYKQVIFVDLDCGQTEFTPPGSLSCKIMDRPLVGPPSSHIDRPDFCEFLGISSVDDDPVYYFDCAERLARKVEVLKKRSMLPVIINTMGWTTGLGFHLLQNLLRCWRPTHVISVQNSIEPGVPQYLKDCFEQNEIEMTDAPPLDQLNPPTIIPVISFKTSEKHASLEAGFSRDIITRIYLNCENIFADVCTFNFRSSLSELTPHHLHLDNVHLRCIGNDPSFQFSFSLLNLAIVSINFQSPHDSEQIHCIGLIRGLSPIRKELLVLAPVKKLTAENSPITLTFRPGFHLSRKILMSENLVWSKVRPYLLGDASAKLRSSHVSRPRKVRSNIQRKYTSAL